MLHLHGSHVVACGAACIRLSDTPTHQVKDMAWIGTRIRRAICRNMDLTRPALRDDLCHLAHVMIECLAGLKTRGMVKRQSIRHGDAFGSRAHECIGAARLTLCYDLRFAHDLASSQP